MMRALGIIEIKDVVLNNAAYGLYGAVEEVSDQQIEQQFKVNVFGSLAVARAAMPYLRQQGYGQIIQIASMAGEYSEPAMGLYSASKWAVEGAFEALAKEVQPFGIKVTIVEPGGIRTDFAGSKSSVAQPMAVYDDTQVRTFMNAMNADNYEQLKQTIVGDPEKMTQQIIKRADSAEGSLRMALGSDAYRKIRASLVERLNELDAQKELAYSTDADDIEH